MYLVLERNLVDMKFTARVFDIQVWRVVFAKESVCLAWSESIFTNNSGWIVAHHKSFWNDLVYFLIIVHTFARLRASPIRQQLQPFFYIIKHNRFRISILKRCHAPFYLVKIERLRPRSLLRTSSSSHQILKRFLGAQKLISLVKGFGKQTIRCVWCR